MFDSNVWNCSQSNPDGRHYAQIIRAMCHICHLLPLSFCEDTLLHRCCHLLLSSRNPSCEKDATVGMHVILLLTCLLLYTLDTSQFTAVSLILHIGTQCLALTAQAQTAHVKPQYYTMQQDYLMIYSIPFLTCFHIQQASDLAQPAASSVKSL
jgi:hypothetical protein